MSKLTFEQVLRTTLANSRLARIIEGEMPNHWWHEALLDDRKDVEDIIDNLCKDLSKLTGRPIQRFSKLRIEAMWPQLHGVTLDFCVQYSFDQLNKNIKWFMKHIIEGIRADPRPEGLLTYPISKICWEKNTARVNFPDSRGRLQNIKLVEPERMSLDKVEKPAHIRTLLELCEDTHFDYQPYVLTDNKGCKILALQLGCEWNDLAIATWEPQPLLSFNWLLSLIIGACFFLMSGGLWWSAQVDSLWLSAPMMILSSAVGIVGGLLTSLLVALFYKPLKL